MASVMPLSLPGGLGLDHHQRNAVDEQRHIGPDVRRPPRRRHGELRHGKEVVGRGIVPIDVVDGPIPTAAPPVEPADGGAVEQQIGRKSIGLQQPCPRGGDRSAATAELIRASSSQGVPPGRGLMRSSAERSRCSSRTSRSDDRSTLCEGCLSDQINVSQPSETKCSSRGSSTCSHSGPEVTPPPFGLGLREDLQQGRTEAVVVSPLA